MCVCVVGGGGVHSSIYFSLYVQVTGRYVRQQNDILMCDTQKLY